MTDPGRVEFAKLGRAHGLRGELRLLPHNPGTELVPQLRRVYLARGQEVDEWTVRAVRPGGKGWLVALEGIDNRTAAEALVHARVLVDGDFFPPAGEGEYYAYELEGATLLDADGASIGVLEAVVDYGAGDILVCRIGGREVLVPFAEPYVGAVDKAAGTIEVDPGDFLE